MGIKTTVHSRLSGLLRWTRKHMALSIYDVLVWRRLFPYSVFPDASADRTTWPLLRNGRRTCYSAGTGACDRRALSAYERFVARIISEKSEIRISGSGYGTVVMSFLYAGYFTAIIVYCLFYFFNSFTSTERMLK